MRPERHVIHMKLETEQGIETWRRSRCTCKSMKCAFAARAQKVGLAQALCSASS